MYPRIRWRWRRDMRRRKLYAKWETRRMIYKTLMASETLPLVIRYWAFKEMNDMKRDSSITRVRNRCQITDRPRGIIVKLGLSRLEFRRRAGLGLIPGIVKR